MIWALDEWEAMTRIFASVWVTMHMAPRWPGSLWATPAHGPASLDDRYVRPVIRSRIPGCRSYDTPHTISNFLPVTH